MLCEGGSGDAGGRMNGQTSGAVMMMLAIRPMVEHTYEKRKENQI